MTIIDVRNHEEFKSGHAENSVNIPLLQIEEKLPSIQLFEQPIVLCCASVNRSGQAVAFLRNAGIECSNGGSWLDV